MKKQHRDITVDGKVYVWLCRYSCCVVYLNKKEIFNFKYEPGGVTPKIVAEAIKEFNYNKKNFKFKRELIIEKV